MNSAKRGSAAQLAVNILYLEQHFLVINKPPTVYSQPNWYTENPKEHEAALTVEELLKQQYPELYKPVREPFCPPKLVHRLDYNTTGAMILATSKRAAKMFAKGFQSRGGFKVRKFYLALLEGKLRPSSEVEWRPNTSMGLIKTQIDGKSAESRFHVLPEVLVEPGLTLCAFEIVTGRKRQIRNHAARALGAPIYGDPHFGTGGDTTAPPSIALHSSKLLIDLGIRTVEVNAPIDFYRQKVWGLTETIDSFPEGVFEDLINWSPNS